MQKQEEDGKIIYQSIMIIAHIFADAIVRAQAEIVGISPNENRKIHEPPSINSQPAVQTEKLTLSVEEAAKVLGISRPPAYEAVRTGKIPSFRFGKRYVIPRAALTKLLAEI